MTTLPYWTAEDVAAMSDLTLADFIDTLRNGERIAMATRNKRAMSRCGFLLVRLAYPELDRRRAAR